MNVSTEIIERAYKKLNPSASTPYYSTERIKKVLNSYQEWKKGSKIGDYNPAKNSDKVAEYIDMQIGSKAWFGDSYLTSGRVQAILKACYESQTAPKTTNSTTPKTGGNTAGTVQQQQPDQPPDNFMAFLMQYKIPLIIAGVSLTALIAVHKTSKGKQK